MADDSLGMACEHGCWERGPNHKTRRSTMHPLSDWVRRIGECQSTARLPHGSDGSRPGRTGAMDVVVWTWTGDRADHCRTVFVMNYNPCVQGMDSDGVRFRSFGARFSMRYSGIPCDREEGGFGQRRKGPFAKDGLGVIHNRPMAARSGEIRL